MTPPTSGQIRRAHWMVCWVLQSLIVPHIWQIWSLSRHYGVTYWALIFITIIKMATEGQSFEITVFMTPVQLQRLVERMPRSIWHLVKAKHLTKAICCFIIIFSFCRLERKANMMLPFSGKNYNTLDKSYHISYCCYWNPESHHYLRLKENVSVDVSGFQFGNLHGFVEISVAKWDWRFPIWSWLKAFQIDSKH